MGGTVKLANPQAAYAFQLDAPDGAALSIRVPAALASRTLAGEAVEVYWQALMRDVAFSSYPGSPLAAAAVADLSRFPAFAGVTPETLFRGDTPGDHEGPFVSQFLLKDVPFGATTIVQRYRVPEAGDDHLTDYGEWLAVQNGQPPTGILHLDPQPRYLRNARDLGEWVHRDFSYQGFLNATLILLGYGAAALDPNNPYRTSATQGGFVTFGAAHILDLVARVGEAALKAAWFQKWLVHRRLRPEAYGGLAHLHVLQGRSYPLHRDFLDSDALARTVSATGAALLPMAYPEGCPTHPAYPAGHATIAGACATVLKAFFNEAFVIPSPVEPDAAGTALVTYSGTLTAGGELNKLASNVALGRDMAGLHWRSDGIDGIALGEAVAIRILSEYCNCHNEAFAGFSLTKFDGTTISVGHIPVA
jgi:membrane-associated phospholipid phosphatase